MPLQPVLPQQKLGGRAKQRRLVNIAQTASIIVVTVRLGGGAHRIIVLRVRADARACSLADAGIQASAPLYAMHADPRRIPSGRGAVCPAWRCAVVGI